MFLLGTAWFENFWIVIVLYNINGIKNKIFLPGIAWFNNFWIIIILYNIN